MPAPMFDRSALLGSLLALVIAIALTVASSIVERFGPAQVSYGNLCGPTSSGECLKPVLAGGFPMAYLEDAPGVSVERQLAFSEDNIRPVPLLFDFVFYWAAIVFFQRLLARRRRSAIPLAPSSEA